MTISAEVPAIAHREVGLLPAEGFTVVESPIGRIRLTGAPDGRGRMVLTGLHLVDRAKRHVGELDLPRDDDAFADVQSQLEDYFSGARRQFDVATNPRGTPFQIAVWRALGDIAFGETISYAELARRVARPGAARAVGAANSRNPVAIVLPCHRVIGADGSLTGYGGGLETKSWLLELERCNAATSGAPRSASRGIGRRR